MRNKFFTFLLMIMLVFTGGLLSGCTGSKNSYDITVQINGAIFGRVSDDVSGTYLEGTSVTITATPYENQTFFCWVLDNKVVSIDAEYTFEISKETAGSYVALFKCADLEYISLESFAFTNTMGGAEGEDVTTTLKSFTLSFGYNQNDLYTVYESVKTEESEVVSSGDLTSLYSEDQFPFAFRKTDRIYVKITTIYDRAGIEYKSETISYINGCNVGEEHSNIESLTLNQATCVANKDLPPLDGSENCQISINFKTLDSFEFVAEEPEEENA